MLNLYRRMDAAEADIGALENGTAFKIGGVAVGTTAAELDAQCDVSTFTQAVTAAGAITPTKKLATLANGTVSPYAVTLAAPTVPGQVLVLEMTVATSAVTLALTNVVGGSAATTATFDAVGETLVLISSGTKWVVAKEVGVTLT